MVIDSIKSSKKDEKEAIPMFNKDTNVHVNVPIGNDAKNQYRYAIRNVKTINPKSFGDINDYENQSAFDQTRLYLISLLDYYQSIEKVYETMAYIANDELIFEKSYSTRTLSALITDEEKELLSEAIDTIEGKLYQMSLHESNCYH
ncbi:hypothetical protein [Methanobrevibacter sp.]|uniref:hypothetical protein n=1 Tax=Methanobrevibacter sp. TaxID=66852 RepID=UPI003869F590